MVKQARAVVTRERIIGGAAEVFVRMNYDMATVADLAKAAGVTQGAVYFHFGSKLELAQEIVRRQHEMSITAGAQFRDAGTPGIESIVLLSGVLAAQIHSSVVVRAGLRLSTESPTVLGEVGRTPYWAWILIAEQLLKRALSEGDLRPDLDVNLAARIVVGSFTGTQMTSQSESSWGDLRRRLEEMWTFLIPLLVPPDRTGAFVDAPRLARAVDPDDPYPFLPGNLAAAVTTK